jgi:polysaccharide export outer membrane protein
MWRIGNMILPNRVFSHHFLMRFLTRALPCPSSSDSMLFGFRGGNMHFRCILLASPVLGMLVALANCTLLPASGPATVDILSGERDPKSLNYSIVEVTPKVIDVQARNAPRLSVFSDRSRPKDIVFGIGDMVAVTIFESASGGLFIPAEGAVRPGNFITIPNQPVDVQGNISIPYAGAIRALGRTQVQVQDAIVSALKNRAIEPQAVVSLIEQKTSMITVLGAGRSARIPATTTPERLLDVIGRAGMAVTTGAVGPAGADTWIILERNGRRAIAPFGAVVYEPANNIYVHPNDTIYLYSEPQTFLTFGALGTQQQVPFGAWRLTLAEAISKAGGLQDLGADPAAVFLYRGEARDIAQSMGIDCSPYPGPMIPVVYVINLRDPSGYFLASSFEMRNKDIIYVSNAFSVESTKFMTWLNNMITIPITAATSAYGLRNIATGTGAVPSVVTTTTTTPVIVPAATP